MSALSFAAIILAAGRSSRMGRFKPLLKVAGLTLIQRAIAVFRHQRIEDVVVVTGHRASDLEPTLACEKVKIAHNASYAQGMFSSVKTGIRELPAHCAAFFVLPVDLAFVQSTTIGRQIEAFCDRPDRIYYPSYASRRGHPPLIPSGLAEAIGAYDGEGGLRQVLNHYEDLAVNLSVSDRFVIFDIDTPQDLVSLYREIESSS